MTFLGYPQELIKKEKARETTKQGRRPRECQTCGCDTGYVWADRPEGAVIWCVNTKCADFHTVFYPEEWQQDRAITEKQRAYSADL